jgi:hypothetical protein
MWHAMFAEQIPLAEKILRTVIVYGLLAVLFRLTGKRGLASMNTFDFVVIFLLSNVVQNAVIGNDTSLIGGIIGAVTLVADLLTGRCGAWACGAANSTSRCGCRMVTTSRRSTAGVLNQAASSS